MKVIVAVYLVINAWTDWKRKQIDLIYTAAFAIVCLFYKLWWDGVLYWEGMLPGCLLLLLACLKKEHIGIGDGVLVMAFGLVCGISMTWSVLTGGFLLAAAVGVILYIFGKKEIKEIPFVPFFLGSYLLELVF